MARPTSLQRAKNDIVKWLDSYPVHIFRYSQLSKLFEFLRRDWDIASHVKFQDFAAFLVGEGILVRHFFKFPRQPATIYTMGDNYSDYEIVLHLGQNAYLSHFSAAYILELTEQIPKTIYLTIPQVRKNRSQTMLSQEAIDEAFSNPVRVTSDIAVWNDYRVTRLSSMNVEGAGVGEIMSRQGYPLTLTSVERTLIDMAVRPVYSGGVQHVLEAFRRAQGKLSTNILISILQKLDFVYPYHQSIGFYMERAGYPNSSLRLIGRLKQSRKFYISHEMEEMDYSERWQLFYPKGF